ncbi:MAG: hypothetical protein HY895_03685 [Deltaproteobacteria bacterium]|nr:hypothetical protein [Deltaproteobacteria bacterium]
MTYNFDPDRWYDNERSAIELIRQREEWTDEAYEKALESLGQRYEEMIRRLDGTFQIPK